ncbi:hypothetical protein [Armatimonas rosea]|uniref:Uncharacterized protein n=1 Tax=Armatimonas rosea TaxID=685828 RepID=A0A7W9SW30_ARMRO|nr:hypothetical protein [Armatimonas rosea]MBB6053915.1 hypothetical protein [Armatimonas rosea]
MQGKFQFAQRYVDSVQERPRWRTTLTERISPKFQIGVEYNANAPDAKLNPVGNYFIQTENESRPGIIAGFSSDRIGTPHGMSYFVSAQKQLSGEKGRVAPYLGLSYSEFGKEVLTPFGASLALKDNLVLLPMCDGKYGHTTLSWFSKRGESISLIAAFNKRIGIAFARNF